MTSSNLFRRTCNLIFFTGLVVGGVDPSWFLGRRGRSEARRQPHMQQLQAVGTRLRVALIRVPINIIT
jgi:hypothetical protein